MIGIAFALRLAGTPDRFGEGGGVPVLHHVCGIDELGDAPIAGAARVISIISPRSPIPPELQHLDANLLVLRFDDVIDRNADYQVATENDIARLLAFDRDHAPDDALVIHCTAGISRSTAALVLLLAQRRPDEETEIFAELREIRPKAWPNSHMIALGDALLGRDGKLVAALREHYRIQALRYPEVVPMMLGLQRQSELPIDLVQRPKP
jgi:predicted protein tyrosine phosphatase